jgi:hypothetical protein
MAGCFLLDMPSHGWGSARRFEEMRHGGMENAYKQGVIVGKR